MCPYVNGQAMVDRAQSVGLSATMIELTDLGHVPIWEILSDYFEDLTTTLYQEITEGAQVPEGCREVWSDWAWNYFNDALCLNLLKNFKKHISFLKHTLLL